MVEYSDKNIKRLIDGIYDGSITEYDLPESLYNAISIYFKKGLYKGFGMTLADATGKDLELLTELRENIYMFSAAKTFSEVQHMNSLLLDEQGDLKPFKDFYTEAKETYDLYNKTWAATEYNTAVGQAQNASKWNEIEKGKKLFPMLRYSAVVDDNTSDICLPLDGMVAAVDDEVWDTIAPENHFNCRCVLLQEEGDVPATDDDDKNERVKSVEENMSDVFKMNAGKDGVIFKDDHPYFQVEKKDKGFAKDNFGLSIPKDDDE